jgi:hypothetical protein
MKNNLILIAILATIGLSSCANWMPFTTAIEEQYDLTADERSQLQLKNNKKNRSSESERYLGKRN